jgi:hypothetical protein
MAVEAPLLGAVRVNADGQRGGIKGPVFGSSDWLAFAVTAAVSLIGYLLTLAPTVTLEMCGVQAVAADHLGVPNNPGYPVWTLVGWVFHHLFCFVHYRGNPNPAWGLAFFSALCSAIACGLTALLVSNVASRNRVGAQGHGEAESSSLSPPRERERVRGNVLAAIAGISAG